MQLRLASKPISSRYHARCTEPHGYSTASSRLRTSPIKGQVRKIASPMGSSSSSRDQTVGFSCYDTESLYLFRVSAEQLCLAAAESSREREFKRREGGGARGHSSCTKARVTGFIHLSRLVRRHIRFDVPGVQGPVLFLDLRPPAAYCPAVAPNPAPS